MHFVSQGLCILSSRKTGAWQEPEPECSISYSIISTSDTERSYLTNPASASDMSVNAMLDGVELGNDTISEPKQRVYRISPLQGYPTQLVEDFKEFNVNDLVLYAMGPVPSEFVINIGGSEGDQWRCGLWICHDKRALL